MKLLCAALRGLTLLMFVCLWILSFGLAASAEVENLALGGDFEDPKDMEEWQLDIADGSMAEMKIDKTTAVIGDCSLFFKALGLSGNDGTRPRFNQVGHIIEKGKTYTFSAFYKAEAARSAVMAVQLGNAPWTLFLNKSIILGTEWKEIWGTFTAPQDAEVSIQPTRNTNSDINYWVDGVRFFEGEYEPYEAGPGQAVSSIGKLTIKWGAIKDRH